MSVMFFEGGIPGGRVRHDQSKPPKDDRRGPVRGKLIPITPDHRRCQALDRLLARRAELESEYDAIGAAAITVGEQIAELDREIKRRRKGF